MSLIVKDLTKKYGEKTVVDHLSFLVYAAVLALMLLSTLLPFKIPAAVLIISAGVFGIFFGKSGRKDSAPKDRAEGKTEEAGEGKA